MNNSQKEAMNKQESYDKFIKKFIRGEILFRYIYDSINEKKHIIIKP